MGLHSLALVAPKVFPDPDAVSRAAGAEDLLTGAYVFSDIKQAIADCVFVVGTTARPRAIEWPVLTPGIAAGRILAESRNGPVAVLFGRERSGLTNKEVERCNLLVRIPTTEDYASLNLACAAQILAYELYLRSGLPNPADPPGQAQADSASMDQFHRHLEQALHDLNFIKVDPPTKLMRKLTRFFNRAQPSQEELNIFRGILSAAQAAARRDKKGS